MKKINITIIFTISLLSILPLVTKAQSFRSLNNNGVEAYKNKKYSDAEVNFKKGLDKNFNSFVAHFNLGDALYKQGRFNEALKEYKSALALAKDNYQRSKVYHNIGNTLLKAKQIKKSIGAYANSLKLDPTDYSTKYNLAYALNLLKNKKKNKNRKNNKKNNKNQKNKQKQNQQQNKNSQNKGNKQKQKNNRQQAQNKKSQISKAEALRILRALKNNEAKLQKKLRRMKTKKKRGVKDW